MMKFSFMEPIKKLKHECRINPFDHDAISMGQPIGTGRLTVMYNSREYEYVYLVDTFTGERVKIEFDKPINWRHVKGG